jgi:hypothetical protein
VAHADGNLYFRCQNGVGILMRATPEGYPEKGSFTIDAGVGGGAENPEGS